MPTRLIHLWLPDGTIACKGLTIADVARPLPAAPVITIYPDQATCKLCLSRWAKSAAS